MWQFRLISSSFLPRRLPSFSVLRGALLPAWVPFRGVLPGGCPREGPHAPFSSRALAFSGAADGPLGILRAIACVCQMGKPRPEERKGLAHRCTVRLSQSQVSGSPFAKEKNKYPVSGSSPGRRGGRRTGTCGGCRGHPRRPLTPSVLVPGILPAACQPFELSIALCFPPPPLLQGGNRTSLHPLPQPLLQSDLR